MRLTITFLMAFATGISAAVFAQQAAPTLTNVVAVKGGYLFLESPRHFVGNCVGDDRRGTVKTFITYWSTRNGASAGSQEIRVNADGSYAAVDGRPLYAGDRVEPLTSRFHRTYNCLVPVLTEGQLAQIGIDGHRIAAVPPYNFDKVPTGVFDLANSDLFKSRRDEDFARGRFVFNSGHSGGIDPHLKGTSIGDLTLNPSPYGRNAVYFTLKGSCVAMSSRSSGTLDTVAKLQRGCSKEELMRRADEASRGVGLMVLAIN